MPDIDKLAKELVEELEKAGRDFERGKNAKGEAELGAAEYFDVELEKHLVFHFREIIITFDNTIKEYFAKHGSDPFKLPSSKGVLATFNNILMHKFLLFKRAGHILEKSKDPVLKEAGSTLIKLKEALKEYRNATTEVNEKLFDSVPQAREHLLRILQPFTKQLLSELRAEDLHIKEEESKYRAPSFSRPAFGFR
jgi:hypothetical protein